MSRCFSRRLQTDRRDPFRLKGGFSTYPSRMAQLNRCRSLASTRFAPTLPPLARGLFALAMRRISSTSALVIESNRRASSFIVLLVPAGSSMRRSIAMCCSIVSTPRGRRWGSRTCPASLNADDSAVGL